MRRATLALVHLLFLPTGSLDTYLEAARKAKRWDLGKCGLLALPVLLLLKDGALLYTVWLCTVILFGVYQYLWVFTYPLRRPVLYEETSLIIFMLVLLTYVAVVTLCDAGWMGAGLVAFSWIYFGRAVGRLAVAKETRKIFVTVCREHPNESYQRRLEIAQQILQSRVAEIHNL